MRGLTAADYLQVTTVLMYVLGKLTLALCCRSSTKLYSGSLDIDSTASSTGKEREGHKAPADALSGPQVTVNHGSTGRVQRHRTRKDSRHESWLHLPSALLPSSMVRPRCALSPSNRKGSCLYACWPALNRAHI